jgi:hypothetical protein
MKCSTSAATTATTSAIPQQQQGRFNQLHKLHKTLLMGLQQHMAAGGADSATSALADNLAHARAFFQQCIEETGRIVMEGSPAPANRSAMKCLGVRML